MVQFNFAGSTPVLIAVNPPEHDNDNRIIGPEWQTPAETIQAIRRARREMFLELLADFRLRHCPDHRRYWELAIEMEKCALWHYYGIR